MGYVGRPGPSPLLAAYFASGLLREEDRVLDVGCGTGEDAMALARWGCRDVTALDRDREALGVAKRRVKRAGLQERVRFVEGDALHLAALLPRAAFDVVWDGLLLNNLRRREEPAHARSMAHCARPGGSLLLQFRVTKAAYVRGDTEAASDSLYRWFDFGPPAFTLIPEHGGGRAPPFARVVAQVGTRNARPAESSRWIRRRAHGEGALTGRAGGRS